MRASLFELIVNIALGAAWVAALGGAYFAYSYVLPHGFLPALSAAVLGLLPGLLVVAFFEGINLLIESHKEQKKQTALLTQILEQTRHEAVSDHRP
ncbi:MAG: hypothetical protein AB7E49_01725 [Campylobacterales bacterium]